MPSTSAAGDAVRGGTVGDVDQSRDGNPGYVEAP